MPSSGLAVHSAVVPSPKSHSHEVASPVDASVKVTVCPGTAVVGAAEKSAAGDVAVVKEA